MSTVLCNSRLAYPNAVIRSGQRKGRIRSAERTEVHLIVTTRLYELTFYP
jgi:hypothetical protein